jgi:DNA-binding Xre family transcriptional regulator
MAKRTTKLLKIKKMLADRNLAEVARRTKLHVNTVRAIASGKNKNPTDDTLSTIWKYLVK